MEIDFSCIFYLIETCLKLLIGFCEIWYKSVKPSNHTIHSDIFRQSAQTWHFWSQAWSLNFMILLACHDVSRLFMANWNFSSNVKNILLLYSIKVTSRHLFDFYGELSSKGKENRWLLQKLLFLFHIHAEIFSLCIFFIICIQGTVRSTPLFWQMSETNIYVDVEGGGVTFCPSPVTFCPSL